MLRYMDQKQTIRWKFVLPQSENLGGYLSYFSLKCNQKKTFRNDCDNKQSVRMKHIS